MLTEDWGEKARVVICTHCPLDPVREEYLKNVFGADVWVLTRDIDFDYVTVVTVRRLVSRVSFKTGCEVAAIEVEASEEVRANLAKASRTLGVMLIHPQFEIDESGNALPKFSHYDELGRTGDNARLD